MSADQSIADELKAGLRRLTRATVGCYVALLVIGFVGWQDANNKRDAINRTAARAQVQATVANNSLCALKRDLEKRIKGSVDFLAQHPEGFAGIPATQIRARITEQTATVSALERGGLTCN